MSTKDICQYGIFILFYFFKATKIFGCISEKKKNWERDNTAFLEITLILHCICVTYHTFDFSFTLSLSNAINLNSFFNTFRSTFQCYTFCFNYQTLFRKLKRQRKAYCIYSDFGLPFSYVPHFLPSL